MMRSLKDLMCMDGRVVGITGGAGCIGRVMAGAVAELGAAVAVIDINRDGCVEVASGIAKEYGVRTDGFAVDLSDDSAVRELPGTIAAELGCLDVLINCAAFVGTSELDGWSVPFNEQSVATWRKALDVNLTAVFNLTQASVPYLKASEHGSIINVSSIYGLYGPDSHLYEGTAMGNPAAYAASKGGLMQFTRWCATMLAPEIRVNAITPGGVFRGQDPIFVKRYKDRTPLQRMATEEDFKGAVCYLASDLSSYVTGQNLSVDGGWGVW